MDQENKIDQYIMGQLSQKEMEAFSKQLLTDMNLAKEVKKRQAVHSGFEAYGNQRMKERIQSVRRSMLNTEATETTTVKHLQRKRRRNLAIAAAAIIILMVIAWQLFPAKSYTPEQLFAKNYQPYAAAFSARELNGKETLVQAESYYQSKNYTAAIPILEQFFKADPLESNLGLTLGNAYLANNQTDQAIAHFNILIQNDDPLYTDQIRWYLALSYLKKGQVTDCKNLLNDLVQDRKADFHEEAKLLLDELK